MGTTTKDHLLGGQHAGEEWNFFQVVSEGGDEMHKCNLEQVDLDLNAEGPFNTEICLLKSWAGLPGQHGAGECGSRSYPLFSPLDTSV